MRVRRASVEECGRGMSEVAFAHLPMVRIFHHVAGLQPHQVVGFDGALDVVTMDANGNAHQHVLRALGNLAVDAKQV